MSGTPVEILSADEAGITEDIVEDGLTFEENALKKARYVAEKTREWSFADDSGVCIQALGCAPGIFSARWARKRGVGGGHAKPENIVTHTLEVMKHIPEEHRGAWMESACAVVAPDGLHWVFTGKIDGAITTEPRGTFHPKLPYDVIFVPEGETRTFAEMTSEEKNSMSHRGQAFAELKKFLAEL